MLLEIVLGVLFVMLVSSWIYIGYLQKMHHKIEMASQHTVEAMLNQMTAESDAVEEILRLHNIDIGMQSLLFVSCVPKLYLEVDKLLNDSGLPIPNKVTACHADEGNELELELNINFSQKLLKEAE